MKRLLTHISDRLNGLYGSRELESVSIALCTEYMGISQTTYYLKEQVELTSAEQEKLDDALNRLSQGEPLQYIVGYTPFCGLHFILNKSVLIPRPETAELVDWVAQYACSGATVLDIGTGSGCIAISLAKRISGSVVDACDVSSEALETASANNKFNGTSVTFYKRNILTERESDKSYDVIVSNPPYITEEEKADMESNVLDYEPHLALFVNSSDPLLFYKAIADFGKQNLNKGGALFFEINPLYATDMVDMLAEKGYSGIELRRDIYGKDRMIKANIYE